VEILRRKERAKLRISLCDEWWWWWWWWWAAITVDK
jgi:hypothetical protein